MLHPALAMLPALLAAAAEPPAADTSTLPIIRVTADDTVIDRSCRVEIAPDAVIRDAAGDGVIQVRASGIVVEFTPGSVLRGAAPGEAPDTYAGVGIRIDGHSDVTLRGVQVSGFKAGLWATAADRLVLEDSRADDLWRHRLRSTPVAEDLADWLWPHRNDANEWLTNYGAAFYIEDSRAVTVRRCAVRRGQNGLILDRVDDSTVYDNDFSFLSGWGLAMWRSSRNTIARNALDFCVRGYSHGVYNRGQDSAGILMFEQCSGNIIAENSATHSGDGFFGFAGREALGETPPPHEGFDYKKRGCNGNLIEGNDFSYAPAHGIEMTFSFENIIRSNRLVENAICGVWGGYSQETFIRENEIRGNGLPGRKEGGGINIEHGVKNDIAFNRFDGNTQAIAMWFDADEGIMKLPWARANHTGPGWNHAYENEFRGDTVGIRLENAGELRVKDNRFEGVGEQLRIDADSRVVEATEFPCVMLLPYELPGDTRPVGARAHLRGRDKIIMGQWGPWDHEDVLVRDYGDSASRVIEVFGAEGQARAVSDSPGVLLTAEHDPALDMARFTITADPAHPGGLLPYAVTLTAPGLPGGEQTFRGALIAATWTVRLFPWTIDPRDDLAAWRNQAQAPEAVETTLPDLLLRYGAGGPADLPALHDLRDRLPWRDRFGTIATTTLHLPAGRYRLTTLSDDGVRVLAAAGQAGPRTIIENWTHHAPTRDSGELVHEQDGPVTLTVEHFEIDGHAVLELTIQRLDDPPPDTRQPLHP